jgi:hypothetical protein
MALKEALETLESKLVDGRIVVERMVPSWRSCHSAKKASPRSWAQNGINRY